MFRLYFKLFFIIAGLLMFADMRAEVPKNAKPFYIKCGAIAVRIMPGKAWTPDIIKYNGQIMALQNGFSGLVADIRGHNAWIGSGHHEGGREKVISFKLFVDGKLFSVPTDGADIECKKAETVKESYLDDLKLTSRVIITENSIVEEHDLTALQAFSVNRLYGFLHCWTNQSSEWMSRSRSGKIAQGTFVNDGSFKLLGDVKWAAQFIPAAKAVIYTEFPDDLPPGEGRGHCIWDIKNYHKQYYQAMAGRQLNKGDSFNYRMKTGFLTADKSNWKQAVLAASGTAMSKAENVKFPQDFFPVDIRSAANMAFKDEKPDDHKGGWTDQGPDNDLKAMTPGVKQFDGIPFDIVDPAANNNKACVVLRNTYRPYLPVESMPIMINRKAQALYLLMTCAWSGSNGKNVAHFIVRYKDSSFYSEIPVTYGRHLSGWWNPQPVSVGKIAWKASNGSSDVGLYSFGWVNPYPEQEIKEIQMVSAGKNGLPILVAVTGVEPSAVGRKLAGTIKELEYKASQSDKIPDQVSLKVDFDDKLNRKPAYSIAFGIGGNCLHKLYRKAAKHLMDAGSGPVLFRYQVSTGVGKAEPALAEDVWDFKKLDTIVDYITQMGAVPMLCFGPGGPIWMARRDNVYGDSKRYWRPENIKEYSAYCRKIAEHYQRRGNSIMWEIGNEVELKRWPASYYLKVYRQVAEGIKNISAKLQTGGPATCNPNLGWVREMMSAYPELVDFVTYHEYGYSETFDSPDSFIMSKTSKYETSAQEYRELINKYIPGRNVPLIITEANINWRWQGGTDPRMRNIAGAAWYASVQGRFWRGGGDALCYFTFGGGFGSCYKSGDDQLTLAPAYHALWLYRKLGTGEMVNASSVNDSVEVYAFAGQKQKSIIVVNKNNAEVKTELSISGLKDAAGAGEYVLNEQTSAQIKYVTSEKLVPQLKPVKLEYSNKLEFVLKPFEVRAIYFK